MEEIGESQKFDLDFTCECADNDVTIYCRGVEIFRITFNPENFAKTHPEIYLDDWRPTKAQINDLIEALQASGADCSRSEAERKTAEALRNIHSAYARLTAEFISNNLCELARAFVEMARKADYVNARERFAEGAAEKPAERMTNDRAKELILSERWSELRAPLGFPPPSRPKGSSGSPEAQRQKRDSFRENVMNAIRDLHCERENVNKAAVARRMNLGSEKTRTQALTNGCN